MRLTILSALFTTVLLGSLPAQETSTVERDDNTPKGFYNAAGFEESVMLRPDGPCRVVGLQIYFAATNPASDTIHITGDPAEGAVPPTSWVWNYNTLAAFVLQYDGTPGWKTYDLSEYNIRSDGHDRIVVQHRIDRGGLTFVYDASAQRAPYGSFLMNPMVNNSLGFPGQFYLADGDFMVRLLVEYDYPRAGGSEDPPEPTMVDVTEAAGLLDAEGALVRSARLGVVDVDGDDWDDIVAGSRLWQNRGDGSFRLVETPIVASASAWGDYDNDGDLDCYATRGGENPDALWRNDGDWSFTEVTDEARLGNEMPGITPIWFDMENDGDLDLFLSNGRSGSYPNEIFYPDRLWRNEGDGTFTEITGPSGIADGEPPPYYDAWGSAAGDYDNDRLVDIFVATYRLAPDLLYRNRGDGTFVDVGAATGVRGEPTSQADYFGHGIGAEFADYDNDGDLDLAVGNLGHPDYRGQFSNPSLIYRNDGAPDYHFTEVHADLGLKFFEMNSGILWGDFNLDGYLDLFHTQLSYQPEGENGEPARLSRIYLSSGPDGDWRLQDVTWLSGLRVHGAWTAARIDYDRDGDLDLVVASSRENLKLYRNDMQRLGSALSFRLEGDPTEGIPADGYGARIVVHHGTETYTRELAGAAGGATGTQQSNGLHVGVGSRREGPAPTAVDSVVVTWGPSVRHVFRNVATGTEYLIHLGSGEIEELEYTPVIGTVPTAADPAREIGARLQEDRLHLRLPSQARGPMRLLIVNSLGRTVGRYEGLYPTGTTLELTLAGRPAAGHYFLRLLSEEERFTGRFEVE